MRSPYIYFAHSKRIYGSDEEKRARKRIEDKCGPVLCPHRDLGEFGGIEPYLTIISRSRMVIVREHRACVGRGVASEVSQAILSSIPVFVLRNNVWIVTGVSVVNPNDWAFHYAELELGKSVSWEDLRKIT